MAREGGKGGKTLRVTWVRSAIGRDKRQGATVKGLGLRRLHHTVEVPDTPAVRGMIKQVIHLVRVEETA
jgi:large subunit ribosomal protein L30